MATPVRAQQLHSSLTGPYFGQTPPGNVPVLFAPPELQSNSDWFWHGALAFSPDSTEFFMDIYYPNANPSGMRIRQMIMTNNLWSSIQPAPFAGEYVSAGMSFTEDGNKVYFVSDRPGGFYWTSLKVNGTWGIPEAFSFPNPSGLGFGWCISVASSGRIYAHLFSAGGTECHLYTIDLVNGQYAAPQKMSDSINSSWMDINAYIDPDEEYLIFTSARPGGMGQTDLYISFRKPDNTWTTARNFGYPINTTAFEASPYVSSDEQFLFFLSERAGDRNPYWVSASVIDSLKQIVMGITDSPGPDPGITIIGASPNPCSTYSIIRFRLPDHLPVTLELFDPAGNELSSAENTTRCRAGINEIWLNTSGLRGGCYVFRLCASPLLPVVGKILVIR